MALFDKVHRGKLCGQLATKEFLIRHVAFVLFYFHGDIISFHWKQWIEESGWIWHHLAGQGVWNDTIKKMSMVNVTLLFLLNLKTDLAPAWVKVVALKCKNLRWINYVSYLLTELIIAINENDIARIIYNVSLPSLIIQWDFIGPLKALHWFFLK